jgi:hypothetical protein
VTHTVGTVDQERSLRQRTGDDDASDATPSDAEGGAGSSAPRRTTSAGTTPSAASDSPPASGTPAPPAQPPAPAQFTSPDGCVWNAQVAMNRRLDLYLMVDSNITLPFVGGWDNLIEGLSIYADHPRAAGTGVGVRFFGIECSPNTYAMPDAPVAPLPGNASAIRSAFPLPFNISPMRPALEGAVLHARSRANAHPEWKQVVVFMTDGFSTDLSCVTTPDSLVDIARDGYDGSPSIPVYVVALASPTIPDNPFDPVDRLGPLEQVALAGGTSEPRPIDLQAPAGDVVDALLSVQRDAEPCEYVIPPEADDPDQLALSLWNSTDALPRVTRRGTCGDGEGYYLDDPAAPTYLVACPATCDRIRTDGNRPTVLTGCPALGPE